MEHKPQLSEHHIQQLFSFCRSKYVRYIDLQYEIVDHLASGIEAEMESDPTMTFNSALNKVYRQFPVTGFSKLVEEKEKAMSKFWWRKIFKSLLQYISSSNIIYTLATFGVFFTILFYFNGQGIIGVGCFFVMASIFDYFKMKKHLKTNEGGEYLILSSFGAAANSIWLSIIVIIISEGDITNTLLWTLNLAQIVGLSLIFTTVFICILALHTSLPIMIKEELAKKYKHLGINLG